MYFPWLPGYRLRHRNAVPVWPSQRTLRYQRPCPLPVSRKTFKSSAAEKFALSSILAAADRGVSIASSKKDMIGPGASGPRGMPIVKLDKSVLWQYEVKPGILSNGAVHVLLSDLLLPAIRSA